MTLFARPPAQISAAEALAMSVFQGLHGLSAAILTLLLLTIRNAWDLVTASAPQANRAP